MRSCLHPHPSIDMDRGRTSIFLESYFALEIGLVCYPWVSVSDKDFNYTFIEPSHSIHAAIRAVLISRLTISPTSPNGKGRLGGFNLIADIFGIRHSEQVYQHGGV